MIAQNSLTSFRVMPHILPAALGKRSKKHFPSTLPASLSSFLLSLPFPGSSLRNWNSWYIHSFSHLLFLLFNVYFNSDTCAIITLAVILNSKHKWGFLLFENEKQHDLVANMKNVQNQRSYSQTQETESMQKWYTDHYIRFNFPSNMQIQI